MDVFRLLRSNERHPPTVDSHCAAMVPLSSSTPPPVINHGSSSTAGAAPTRFRIQGYDPLLIVAQIISLQSLHYLTLLLLLPPVLSIVANPRLLDYEGGPRNIALLMDWRSFTGRALVEGATSRAGRAAAGTLVALGHDTNSRGAVLGIGAHEIRHGLRRVVEDDAARGWCVAFCWTMTSMIELSLPFYHVPAHTSPILIAYCRKQRRLPISSHPATNAHSRFRSHAPLLPHPPDNVLLLHIPDIAFLLEHSHFLHRCAGCLGRAVVRKERDERRVWRRIDRRRKG